MNRWRETDKSSQPSPSDGRTFRVGEHTPTPWEVDSTRKPYAIQPTGDDVPLGHVFRSHVKGHEGQQEANASFICRAVNSHASLLEALKSLHACHRAFSSNDNWTMLDDDTRDFAEQAIANAEKEG